MPLRRARYPLRVRLLAPGNRDNTSVSAEPASLSRVAPRLAAGRGKGIGRRTRRDAGTRFLQSGIHFPGTGAGGESAARAANVAAGIVVGKLGAASVSYQELSHAMQVKPGDVIKIAEKAKNQLRVKESITLSQEMDLVAVWMEVSNEKMEGIYKAYPDRNDLSADINESLIVELYSK